MKKLVLGLVAVCVAASGSAVYAQVSNPNIRYEERYYSDVQLTQQTGHYVEYCDGSVAMVGHPDIYSSIAYGNC